MKRGVAAEKEMVTEFGEAYRAYQRRVPMFIPCWGQWHELVDRMSTSGGEERRAH
ncbi:MAG TPA: hypothetical protein VIK60_01170 [Vicinamibacterales bacterium]